MNPVRNNKEVSMEGKKFRNKITRSNQLNEYTRKWMALPKKTIRKGTVHPCVVVTNADGSALDLNKITSLPETFRGKYFVPSPMDFLNKTMHQRLHVLDRAQYQTLTGMKVALDEAESILSEISSDCLVTLCINDNETMSNG